ncbi:MAG: hypothetical protein AAFR51_10085 [Pseudomonadota bacterium]
MGPTGPYCEACGTELQALGEDGDVVMPPVQKRRPIWFKLFGATFVLALLGGAGVYAADRYGLKMPDFDFVSASDAPAEPTSQLLVADPLSLVQRVTLIDAGAETLTLIAAQGCQRVAQTPAEIAWVTPRGDRLFSLSPLLPDNWQVQEVCPTRTNGAIASAVLSDGLAISEISANGSISWTRILPVEAVDAMTLSTKIIDEQVLVISPTPQKTLHLLTAYGLDSVLLWQRLLPEVRAETSPILASSPLGDILIVYNVETDAGTYAVRVTALTPQNTVTYSVDLEDRTLPATAVTSDDLGRVLVLEGRSGIAVQLLSASGAPVWRRWIDPQARPIGAIFDGDQFLVVGHKAGALMLWGVRENGTRSRVIELPLDVDLTRGVLQSLNDVQASLEVMDADGGEHRLILNLVRLSEALVYDGTDSDVRPPSPREVGDVALELPATDPSVSAQVNIDAPMMETEAPPETPMPDPASRAAIEVTPPVAEIAEQAQLDNQANEPESAAAEMPTPDRGLSPEPAPAEPAEVQCLFACAANGNAAATYPIMQTVPLFEGEAVTDVPERLTETHAGLCQLSGGQPVVESLPDCTAR